MTTRIRVGSLLVLCMGLEVFEGNLKITPPLFELLWGSWDVVYGIDRSFSLKIWNPSRAVCGAGVFKGTVYDREAYSHVEKMQRIDVSGQSITLEGLA